MKNILYFLLIGWSFLFCGCQNERFNFLKSLGNGYYSIPNQVNDSFILPSYTSKEQKDSIILERILYEKNNDNLFLLIGDIMGSKTSLILAIQPDSLKVIYAEEIPKIDTLETLQRQHNYFFLISTSYIDICSEQEELIIYLLNEGKLYKSFSGLKKEKYYETENPLCKKGISYIQIFKLDFIDNKIILKAKKQIEGGISEIQYYDLKDYYFQ